MQKLLFVFLPVLAAIYPWWGQGNLCKVLFEQEFEEWLLGVAMTRTKDLNDGHSKRSTKVQVSFNDFVLVIYVNQTCVTSYVSCMNLCMACLDAFASMPSRIFCSASLSVFQNDLRQLRCLRYWSHCSFCTFSLELPKHSLCLWISFWVCHPDDTLRTWVHSKSDKAWRHTRFKYNPVAQQWIPAGRCDFLV